MRARAWPLLVLLSLIAACTDDTPATPDAMAALPDAPPLTPDAAPDAPQPDAAPDAPQPDAAPPDAASPTPDASPDALPATPDAAPDAAPPADAAPPTGELSFRPTVNGFSFENYTNDLEPVNLTPDELTRMFGDQVCALIDRGVCTLTPPADRFMKQLNEAMDGGHCEGMAVLSLLFFTGQRTVTEFGAATPYALGLENNLPLQRELAYWFTTQATEPTSTSELKNLTPVQVADRLAAAFRAGGETYTMGIFKPGYIDGHAITPYAVVNTGPGQQRVMVYDNNYPGLERYVEIDRRTNRWRYLASTNPSEPDSEYIGDAGTFTLTLTPTSPRLGQQECPFCSEGGGGAPSSERRQIWLGGDANLLISDAMDRRLGYIGGTLVNEIPGATAVGVRSADLWKYDSEPLYLVPATGELTVSLDGTMLNRPSRASVTLIAPGYVLAVEDVMLDPRQLDTIQFSSDGTEILYETSSMETPAVLIGVETETAAYLFVVSTAGDARGQSIGLGLDEAAGQLRIDLDAGSGEGAYAIAVVRIDEGGVAMFTHAAETQASADVVYLEYGTWAGDGSPMTLHFDYGRDGSIDESYQISDEG
jgi:hypothetical protein